MIHADLHMHSRFSDGLATCRELFELAAAKNLQVVSITDHDTLAAYEQATPLAAEFKIQLLSGIEISCEYEKRQLHLLGYGMALDDAHFLSILYGQKQARQQRVRDILALLSRHGMPIAEIDVPGLSQETAPGRPHVARAMIAAGYVKNIEEAFFRFLSYGRPAYIPSAKLQVGEAIRLIQNGGGVAVLAHPGLNIKDMNDLKPLVGLGLDGLEVYHPKHDGSTTRLMLQFTIDHQLLFTGGSDFHGDTTRKRDFATHGLTSDNLQPLLTRLQR